MDFKWKSNILSNIFDFVAPCWSLIGLGVSWLLKYLAKLKVQSFLRTGLDVLRSQIETRQSALCAAAASSLGYTTTPCPMSWSTYLPTFQSNASPFHQLLISEAQL